MVCRSGREIVLGFANAVDELVPAVAHDGTHSEEEDSRTETLGGQVALDG